MPLNHLAILAAKPRSKPYKLTDAGGLYLEIRPSGAKVWRYRYRIEQKENQYTIGEFFADQREGHISLERARRARDEARILVKKGVHPLYARREAVRLQTIKQDSTFKAVAKEWISRKGENWSKRHTKIVKRALEVEIFPAIGARPMDSISPVDILQILQNISGRGANAYACTIRQWLAAIFHYAIRTLRATGNPALVVRGAIVRGKAQHSKALSPKELKHLVLALQTYRGDPGTKLGLRLMLLTFVRTIELRGACWSEFDLEAREWRIPAERMKMREPHIVPLSRQAAELLRELHGITGHREFLFPNRRNPKTYISATVLNGALKRLGFLGENTIGFSAHGFRATASTLLHEVGFHPDVIERQLAHQNRSQVRASYNHATYMAERQTMMQAWADLVDAILGHPSNVVALSPRTTSEFTPIQSGTNYSSSTGMP